MFHLVSLSLQISLTFAWLSPWPVCVGCCCCCLFGWVGFWFLSLGKFVFNHKLTPVVDRPSLALVRQCRGKKKIYLAFHEGHMGLQGRAFQANIFIVDMVFLGDTRSAEELAVFTNMAPERLCLGCGLRAEEKFTPIFPGERGSLLLLL